MITTVTLNAAIDKTYYMPRFSLGRVSRVHNVYAEPGGKGINVARVIHLLGYPVVATGFLGGSNGEWIRRGLERQELAHDFVNVDGESRLCLNLIDESAGESTEVLEPGPEISEKAMEQLAETVQRLARQSSIVCFSGSLPRGVPSDYYARLVTVTKQAGAKAFLDASGPALQSGIKAAPCFIKPNQEEMAQLLGSAWNEKQDTLLEQLDTLHQSGLETISVSLGAEGAYTSHSMKRYRVRAPHLRAVNTVGCGDAYVAGMAVAVHRGLPIKGCLAYAAAAGSANALTARAGYVDPLDVEELLGQVTVEGE
ncbi:1-phosphofructokinase [Paenibacillus rigui]|uniref:Tagatose-6-phosphate kinase n=1 Tax=Paenibacillus rigui TaxID=554312 RepID=A0A229UWF9_9BACL|nr:1-phosphofructokinase [Paenibacillus rigui]OXM87249.1 1-phosphofructokinase [Paenibacillus rigui]